jgi:hypothetical protein
VSAKVLSEITYGSIQFYGFFSFGGFKDLYNARFVAAQLQ